MGGRRYLPVRPLAAARGGLRDRHPAAHGERQPAHRARVLVHPHRPDRTLPADARQDRLLPDGVGRQRAADRAPCGELLRGPLRPLAALSTRGFDVDALERTPGALVAVSRPNFIGLCERLTAEDERAYEDVFRRTGLSVDWTQTYTTIDERSRRASQRAFVRLLASRPRVPGRGADDVGHRLPDRGGAGRDRGSRDRRRVPPHPVRRGPTVEGSVEIETSRPELIPACVALVVNPTDDRYRDRSSGRRS